MWFTFPLLYHLGYLLYFSWVSIALVLDCHLRNELQHAVCALFYIEVANIDEPQVQCVAQDEQQTPVSLRIPQYIWMYDVDLPCWEHYVKSTLVRYSVRIPNARGNATMFHPGSDHRCSNLTRARILVPHSFLRAYVSPNLRLHNDKRLMYLDAGYGGVIEDERNFLRLSCPVSDVAKNCRNILKAQLQKARRCTTCFPSCCHQFEED
jgi:hypothetical protein